MSSRMSPSRRSGIIERICARSCGWRSKCALVASVCAAGAIALTVMPWGPPLARQRLRHAALRILDGGVDRIHRAAVQRLGRAEDHEAAAAAGAQGRERRLREVPGRVKRDRELLVPTRIVDLLAFGRYRRLAARGVVDDDVEA